MISSIDEQLGRLAKATSDNCINRGPVLVESAQIASKLLIQWLNYLIETKLTSTADCLLSGTLSAVREGVACVALGLVRPALASLRLQVDLSLGWLYFKDHGVEWSRVQETGEGFKLKTELIKYLAEHHPKFRDRMGILKDCRTRSQEDPYKLLSAHIHAQSELALPRINFPSDIVGPDKLQDEFVLLQFECAEFVNDIFWSVYAERWTALSEDLRNALDARFKTPAQRAEFYSER